jgi:hypothetical protein
LTTAVIKILDIQYHPKFKSQNVLEDSQDSAVNGIGEMAEITQAGGIKM